MWKATRRYRKLFLAKDGEGATALIKVDEIFRLSPAVLGAMSGHAPKKGVFNQQLIV